MLNQSEVDSMLQEIERVCKTQVQAAVARHEVAVTTSTLNELTQDLLQLGILSEAKDAAEFGLWQQTEDANGMRLSLQTLRMLGQCSAGLAYFWHRMALTNWLRWRAGLSAGATPAAVVALLSQGHYGLAREALPQWLANTVSTELADWLNAPEPLRYFQTSGDWQALLLPIWQDDAVQWAMLPRAQLKLTQLPAAPGFDELTSFALQWPQFSAQSQLPVDAARACFRELMVLDALGLLAIACGSLERGHELAWTYARQRRQGGQKIVEHPAVSLMLADIGIALESAQQQLVNFQQALEHLQIVQVLRARAALHPALCLGADQALQVYGGMGYMRDCGVEKVWREQQQLRRLGGSSLELRLFASHWEQCA